MKKELLTLFCVAGISFPALGGTYNIAPKARATASSSLNADGDASKVNDGYIRLDNAGEWVSAAQMPYWQQLPYPWIRLDWDEEVTLSRIVLYDRPTGDAHTAGGDLFFSDGTRIGVVGIPDNGEPKVVEFAPKRVRWVKFEVNDAVGSHVGLSEIEAFPPAGAGGDFVSQVNPFIETTKGRYFFFITGNQPFGMIGAAPLTRNRNQYGGGLQLQFDRGARLPADTQLGAGRAYAHADDRQRRSHPRRRALEIALPARGRNRPAGLPPPLPGGLRHLGRADGH